MNFFAWQPSDECLSDTGLRDYYQLKGTALCIVCEAHSSERHTAKEFTRIIHDLRFSSQVK